MLLVTHMIGACWCSLRQELPGLAWPGQLAPRFPSPGGIRWSGYLTSRFTGGADITVLCPNPTQSCPGQQQWSSSEHHSGWNFYFTHIQSLAEKNNCPQGAVEVQGLNCELSLESSLLVSGEGVVRGSARTNPGVSNITEKPDFHAGCVQRIYPVGEAMPLNQIILQSAFIIRIDLFLPG